MSKQNRTGDIFLNNWREVLGNHGFIPDPGSVERTPNGIVIYHYTHPQHLQSILSRDGGLRARIWVDYSELSPELDEGDLAEGFLEPMPKWLTDSPYFGNLGFEMMREYIGNVLLRLDVPLDFPSLYVADYAHALECKHVARRGRPALGLGYDCTTGRECMKAYLHSYVPLAEYHGGHVAPVVQLLRRGEGIVVPSRFITVADQQPLSN